MLIRQILATMAMMMAAGASAPAATDESRAWTFEDDAPGTMARGFAPVSGAWKVVASEGGRAFAQVAESPDAAFNVALVGGTKARDLDLSVKLKAVAGVNDQGGGLVWRAGDARNYYVARFNHLEDNFRVYKVVDGVRSKPLQSADVPHHEGWTVVRVMMKGDHFEGFLDGKKYLDVTDPTFPDAGQVGLWSKSDARSEFDDLTLSIPAGTALDRRSLAALVVTAGLATNLPAVEDWGAYQVVPASAPELVLEAVGAGTTDGTVVSIGKPVGSASQKWIITPKGGNLYAIGATHAPSLVLAASRGGTRMGTLAVLETDRGDPSQRWALRKNDDGSYTLIPAHAPDKGLDHLGGKRVAGAQVDLWTNAPGDRHLQWMIRPLAGTVSAPVATPPSPYVAPEVDPASIPKGQVKDYTFTTSEIFPGTVRQVSVFIPAQYDGSKPACVSVKTDGYNPAEKALLEAMIAAKEIPVTIGVFVRPGETPAPMPGTIGRRNRCLEYDGMGADNVRFLVEELLPDVAARFGLKLSTSGNDRCISGGSSGGIAAFNAAWERPDAFSRVYANSGSFVAFRGGHEFPTLVRKFEPKPIRAYLTTGTRDMENCAGDWFLIDLEMDKALKFSGYDYRFRTIDGGHVAGYYDQFREAMAYLWKGWPEPVQAGPGAPRVRDILLPGEGWRLVAEGRHDAKDAASNARGEVYFVEGGDDAIRRIDLDGKIADFVTGSGHADGLTLSAEDRLLSVSSRTGRVVRHESTGGSTVVAEGLPGRHLLATPEGGLYVSIDTTQPADRAGIWFVKDGKKTRVDSGLKSATGLAYRPDRWLLAAADGGSKWAYSYQVDPNGPLSNKERFFWLHVADEDDDTGAEAICYAREGPMLVATRWGVQACADDGPTQAILPMPDRSRVFGLCLGGRDLDTLYAFCGSTIWSRKVKVHAVTASTPWTRVDGSKL